jgi:hypothetical protein
MDGTLTLRGGGKVIERVADFSQPLDVQLPAEERAYELELAAERYPMPYSTLSTKIDATYTFRSRTTTTRESLPLMAVRYAPDGLDDQNRAAPNSVTTVPVQVQRNPGAKPARVTSLSIQVSFDDGTTWRPLKMVRTRTGWTTSVHNPASGFASLRAEAKDSLGNMVAQTILRGYRIAS